MTPPDPPLGDGVVVLRPFVEADVDQITAACQDEGIQQFIPIPRPYRRADAEHYVARTRRQWAEGWKAAFAIVAADDPATVLGAINLAVVGSVGNSAYWIAPDARGRHLASRALQLVTDWAFGSLGLGVVLLEIDEHNEASRRVAAHAGFRPAGRMAVAVGPDTREHLLYSRLAVDIPDERVVAARLAARAVSPHPTPREITPCP
jgi:RimJ/RimL family protein N-acetyltransferase